MIDTCDLCFKPFNYLERHVATERRPSDPRELCSIMACCPNCAKQGGQGEGWPTPLEIKELYIHNQPEFAERYGDDIMFLSV